MIPIFLSLKDKIIFEAKGIPYRPGMVENFSAMIGGTGIDGFEYHERSFLMASNNERIVE